MPVSNFKINTHTLSHSYMEWNGRCPWNLRVQFYAWTWFFSPVWLGRIVKSMKKDGIECEDQILITLFCRSDIYMWKRKWKLKLKWINDEMIDFFIRKKLQPFSCFWCVHEKCLMAVWRHLCSKIKNPTKAERYADFLFIWEKIDQSS